MTKSIFQLNLPYWQDTYIHVVKKPTSSWIYDLMVTLKKKYIFCENFTTQTFLEQSAPLPPQLKLFLTFCQYHVKTEGCRIPEHPDIKMHH